jgi:glycosyltransferase involved in cell wall biosynthesis
VRVLYLNHNVAGTGTYQRASNLAAELASHGHDVTLVTTSRHDRSRGAERQQDGVHVIQAPDLLMAGGRNGWDLWNTSWRMRRLKHEHFDLIHAFDCRPAVIWPALAQQRRTGAALFIDWADWWGRGGTIADRSSWLLRTFFGPVETWFEEAYRERALANTTISVLLKERCERLGVPGDRIRVLPNGCRAPFSIPGGRMAAHERCRTGAGPLVVHLGVVKGGDADLLFSAFRRVLQRWPQAQLALLGDFRGSIPKEIAARVRRTGYLVEADLYDWLAAADAGVVAMHDTLSNRARWPGKVNEYLTAGLPVVMPAVGAAAGFVERSGAGVVCAPGVAALAEAMLEVLESPERREAMSERGRSLASGPLSWQRIGVDLLSFYGRWMPRLAEAG